jgi:hypothetical protein
MIFAWHIASCVNFNQNTSMRNLLTLSKNSLTRKDGGLELPRRLNDLVGMESEQPLIQ